MTFPEDGHSCRPELVPAARDVLSLLREERSGLIADIDGTLSPLAPTPAAASVSPSCRQHLSRLAGRLALVAIVSGRSATDSKRLVDVEGLVYVGNHGLEMLTDVGVLLHPEARPFRRQIAALLEELETLCAEIPGVIVEDKGVTASIHYRLAGNVTETRRRLLAAVRESPSARGLWITEGKMVIEIRPPLCANKGTAVRELADRFALQGVVYLGDDRTDLDAFNVLAGLRNEGRLQSLSIAVVGPETPPEVRRGADYCLDGVPGVEQLLSALAAALTR